MYHINYHTSIFHVATVAPIFHVATVAPCCHENLSWQHGGPRRLHGASLKIRCLVVSENGQMFTLW